MERNPLTILSITNRIVFMYCVRYKKKIKRKIVRFYVFQPPDVVWFAFFFLFLIHNLDICISWYLYIYMIIMKNAARWKYTNLTSLSSQKTLCRCFMNRWNKCFFFVSSDHLEPFRLTSGFFLNAHTLCVCGKMFSPNVHIYRWNKVQFFLYLSLSLFTTWRFFD